MQSAPEPRRAAKQAFGRAIERLRRAKGLTQAEFGQAVADNLGGRSKWRTQKVISQLESGITPVSIEDVVTFAVVLQMPADALLVTWAEELSPEDFAGSLLIRARTLTALEGLAGVVRQATAEFLISTRHEPGNAQEMAALAAELLLMPKSQRKTLFKLVGALQGKEEVDE